MIGVNGVGKTTSVGKLAGQLKEDGKKVLMVAADTFRAAAIEQLTEWAGRAGVDIIAQQEGSDPGRSDLRRHSGGKIQECGRADLRYGRTSP